MNEHGCRSTANTVAAIASAGFALAGPLWVGSIALLAANQIPRAAFVVLTIVCLCIVMLSTAIGLVMAVRSLEIASRSRSAYLRSWLLVSVPLCLALASASYGNPLIRVLSVVPLVFMVYLRRRTLLPRAKQPTTWQFECVAHLNDETTEIFATKPRGDKDPFLVYPVEDARSSMNMGQALFEHPPHDGDAVVRFQVTPIPKHVAQVGLRGYYGIMDGFTDKNGVAKRTTFEPNSQNKVRFGITVDKQPILEDDVSDFGWFAVNKGPFPPHDGSLTVELRTNALGEAHCNWAAWRNLRIVKWTEVAPASKMPLEESS
jgi:hypothetical protein